MEDKGGHEYSKLPDLIDNLKPHDHLCLIYESREEWLATVVPFISSGLKRDEKCIYVVDANTAGQIKEILKKAGLAVDDYESKGQLSIIHERDTYTRAGYFDPDLMIALLIEETKNALNEGYPALRITGEMSWALRDYGGVERVLEYEAKLNRDLFPDYPCVAICQYDRWKFDPEIIKGVVMTHPRLIRGGQIYHNFYYVEPDEYLSHKKGEIEVQLWLNNLERESKAQESLRESEERFRVAQEISPDGFTILRPVRNEKGEVVDFTWVYENQAIANINGTDPQEVIGKRLLDLFPEHSGTAIYETYIAVANTGQFQVIDDVYVGEIASKPIWLRLVVVSMGEDIVIRAQDISARKKAEEALLYQNNKMKLLLDISKAMAAKKAVRPLSQAIVDGISELTGLGTAAIYLLDGSTLKLEATYPPLPADFPEHLRNAPLTEHPHVQRTLVNKQQVVLADSRVAELTAAEKEVIESRELRSQLFVPLVYQAEAIGVLIVASKKVLHNFCEDEIAICQTLASQAALSVKEALSAEQQKRYLDELEKKNASLVEAEEEIRKLNEDLDQRVRERTTQLEAVNKELESFAYSVSHDFRAPLRALDGFSSSLNEKYADQLDEQGLHYLKRISNAALYMSDLVDALLNLSRITRTDLKEQEVDISCISEDILKELQEAEPKRRVKIVVEPGLSAKGDLTLIKAVLENLLGNAWKFSSKETQAEIEVGRTTVESEAVFFVLDNGVGFNMAYADKLFGAFQHLHRVDEFPGTGIGLATVQRIINRHGGNVWAESEVGKGAIFYFTLGQENSGN